MGAAAHLQSAGGGRFMIALAGTLMVVAAVLYTAAIIWSQRSKSLSKRHLAMFVPGFALDLTATHMMFMVSGGALKLNIHSIAGVLGVSLMGLHLVWALLAVGCHGPWEKFFHRYSRMALTIWWVAFLSGVVIGIQGGIQ